MSSAAAAAGPASDSAPDAGRLVEHPEFARLFAAAGSRGTLVVHELEADRWWVHDADRAAERFIPASTFKIPNSLIALETGAIATASVVLPWDGREREIRKWNRDHSLRSAYRNSVVWYYQEVARRVGEERMRAWLERLGYGNASIDGGVDRFWLDGDLRISALEQIDFLVRLHHGDLPFAPSTLESVQDIMVEERGDGERGDGFVLRAKTGWVRRVPGDLGWYVGWVASEAVGDRPPRTVFFALNLDLERSEQAAERKRIVRAALADLGALPASSD